jgi:hypothetical protein
MNQDELDKLLAKLIKFERVTGDSMAEMYEYIEDENLHPHILKTIFFMVGDQIEASVAYVKNEDWAEYNRLVDELGR